MANTIPTEIPAIMATGGELELVLGLGMELVSDEGAGGRVVSGFEGVGQVVVGLGYVVTSVEKGSWLELESVVLAV